MNSRQFSAAAACRAFFAAAALGLSASVLAAPIVIADGDFSVVTGNGVVGGGAIGLSGTGAIGSGPWQGTYAGVLNLLAPPALSISNGRASIGGLAGVNVLGIFNNSGYFSQSLATPYAASQHYVLSADVDAGVLLNVGVLNDGNAGIALTNGTIPLATTSSGSGTTVSLSLISGTTYQLVLTYDTGTTVSGDIGVELFASPRNLVTANLLTSVSFSNVTLTQSELNPVATAIGSAGGTPQGATINTAFPQAFGVDVVDAELDPVANVDVTFTPPPTGASVLLSATVVKTDSSGHAAVTGTANGTAGPYTLTAQVAGVATPAQFLLTNLAASAHSVNTGSGTPQSAIVNTAFGTPLGVTVTDVGSNPLAGISVTFSAPGTGASATFSNNGSATTNALGQAQVNAVANTVAGNYNVTASVNGAVNSALFALTNTAGSAYLAIPAGGTPQSALVSTAFNTALSTQVTDAYGNPSSGVTITFTAPGIGPSASFGAAGTTTSAVTDANGVVQVTADANGTPGTYQVTAAGTSLATQAVYNLTNTTTSNPHGNASSGTPQSANVGAAFECMLQLHVTSDGTTAMPGVQIAFVAPTSGPSATLAEGADMGTTVTGTTDANGLVGVTATANTIAGTYEISAGVYGSGSSLATYVLTNFEAGERLFLDGFESSPAICP